MNSKIIKEEEEDVYAFGIGLRSRTKNETWIIYVLMRLKTYQYHYIIQVVHHLLYWIWGFVRVDGGMGHLGRTNRSRKHRDQAFTTRSSAKFWIFSFYMWLVCKPRSAAIDYKTQCFFFFLVKKCVREIMASSDERCSILLEVVILLVTISSRWRYWLWWLFLFWKQAFKGLNSNSCKSHR